jgi:hypothetical protein
MRLTQSNTSLQTFEQDVNVSASTKSECFKFLRVIIQNLLKTDGDDLTKYRQLRLTNAKVQRITGHAAVLAYLQQTIGFERVLENGESLLRILGREAEPSTLQTALAQVTAAQERIQCLLPRIHTVSNSSSAASLPDVAVVTQPQPQLTAKQQTRILSEKRELADKEAARVARKRTVAQIKADKHVRENDPNWKPAVSAASAKNGDTMESFRGKFGEE